MRRARHALAVAAGAAVSSVSCSLLFGVEELVGGASTSDAQADEPSSADASDASRGDYRTAVLADGPVAYFRFGDPAGALNAANEVPGALGGTYFGGGRAEGALAPFDRDPGLSLDGGAYVELGQAYDFDGTKPYTYECWLKPSLADTAFRHVLTKQDRSDAATKRGPAVLVRNNALFFERYVDGGGGSVSTPIASNEWTHVVAIFDGGRMRLYLNATEAVQPKIDIRSVGPIAVPFMVGKAEPSSINGYVGIVDELAIYDRALTVERIKAHFDAAR